MTGLYSLPRLLNKGTKWLCSLKLQCFSDSKGRQTPHHQEAEHETPIHGLLGGQVVINEYHETCSLTPRMWGTNSGR